MSENVNEDLDIEETETPLSNRPFFVFFAVCAGILLPVITLIAELGWKLCSTQLFDPIPTLWHVLIVSIVPMANAQLLWSLYKNRLERTQFLGWVSAIAAGASLFYSLIFLPVTPIAVLAIIIAGLGLLALAPIFSFWANCLLRRAVSKRLKTKTFLFSWKGVAVGFLIVLGIIAVSESRFIATRYGLEKAMSENLETQVEGMNFLRKYGDENHILNLSYSGRRQFYISDYLFNAFDNAESSSQTKAREVYYRLTGKTFDSQARPQRFDFGDSETRFWREQDISLASSQIDASIDNDASLGYLEWTFTLKNSNKYRALEGFTQIQLPPNAVVSRVTLWINGEEREAAYAERGRVTKAYEQVTASKRDPVLVTTAGRDRINLKCFPIPANNGEMKMKIGVTFPLILENEKSGLIRLPYFRDRNFQIPDSVKHSVWLESKRELQSKNQNLKVETKENLFAVRGELSEAEMTDASSSVRAVKSDQYKTVWTKSDEGFITQEVFAETAPKPARFVFVVDTSAPMAKEKENLIAKIKSLPEDTETSLVLTSGNALNTDLSLPNSLTGKPAEIAEKISQAEFAGGTDNMPALTKAWDLANEKSNSVVIWIHAPQPHKFTASENLHQRLARRPNQTTIYALSTVNGLDVIEKELDNLSYLVSVPRFSDVGTDLERLVNQLNQSQKTFGYNRVNVAKTDLNQSKETSAHLLRLWANDEVNRILANNLEDKKAVELAVKHRIVTPVTGAVVLETAQQYEQFGLRPVEKGTVPTIPEPEFYLLLAVILGVFVWLFAIRKLF